MLKRIYDWCIAAADKPYALWILAAVSFAESSFFPIPPDVMLLPMSLARPQRAWFFAGVCTVASVAGGLVGYAIGALLYDSLGQWLMHIYNLTDKVETFRQSYAEWGAVIILLKGLTPIPYKLVTITSGFAGYNIWLFILCSIVARGGRFFVLAVLLNRYGDFIRTGTGEAPDHLGGDRRHRACRRILHRLSIGLALDFLGPARARTSGGRMQVRTDHRSANCAVGAAAALSLVLIAAGPAWPQIAPPAAGVQPPSQQSVPNPPSRSRRHRRSPRRLRAKKVRA